MFFNTKCLFLLLWFMDDAFKWILPLMQLREFWMQRRWQLHLLWHLLVVCTLLTWNTTWAFEDKFYHMASVAVPPSFVSCRLSKVCLNPSFMRTTHGWLQPPSLCVGQISNPNMASNISFSLMKEDCLLDTLCWGPAGYCPVWWGIICIYSPKLFLLSDFFCIEVCMSIENVD